MYHLNVSHVRGGRTGPRRASRKEPPPRTPAKNQPAREPSRSSYPERNCNRIPRRAVTASQSNVPGKERPRPEGAPRFPTSVLASASSLEETMLETAPGGFDVEVR